MGWASSGHHRRRRSLLLVLFLLAASLVSCSSASGGGVGEGAEERRAYYYYSRWESARRKLVGPGSSPPTCRSRCGGCHPCRPVHVAIQPGLSFPLEYYPEAWRCKCGDKLFMP